MQAWIFFTGIAFFDDGCKAVGIEACTADQSAIYFRLGHEASDVVWLDAAAIQDANTCGGVFAKSCGHFTANDAVGISDLVGGGRRIRCRWPQTGS